MIKSAEEFIDLRCSDNKEEYDRSAQEEAPVAVWYEIITNFPDMRKWVAHNKTVPLEILELLAKDESPIVRSFVARKRKLSEDLFRILCRDDSEIVRHKIVFNKRTPKYIMEILAKDDVPFVRQDAIDRLRKEYQ